MIDTIRLTLMSVVLLGLVACASSGSQDNSQTTAASVTRGPEVPADVESGETADKLVCHRERVTGSNRFEKICKYQSQIDADRKATQEGLRQLSRRNPKDVEAN